MRKHVPAENTALAIALALGFFGGLAALAAAAGVFEKLSADELAALAAFALGFALLTYFADRQVRAVVDGVIATLRRRSARPDRKRDRPARIRTRPAA